MLALNHPLEISLIGLLPALILLVFPNANYFLKALLTTLTATYLAFISIVTAGWIIDMYHDSGGVDTKGIIFFISFIYGSFLAALSGLTILAIFIAKNATGRKVISRIFKNN